LALVLWALDLFHAPGDHIEEESESDNAMYALRALRTSIRDFVEEAAISELGQAAALLMGVGFPCGGGFPPAGPLVCSEFAAQGDIGRVQAPGASSPLGAFITLP
jgi:hypothetical protein